jgi:hypothetical protein
MAGRPCTVCGHPDRREIEAAAARGDTPSSISQRFAKVSDWSIRRHMADHAPKAMQRAIVAVGGRDLAAGIGLNEEAHALYDRTLAILEEAERTKQLPVALLAIREARGNLELLGKFTGKLKPETVAVQAVKVTLRIGQEARSWLAAGEGPSGGDDAS